MIPANRFRDAKPERREKRERKKGEIGYFMGILCRCRSGKFWNQQPPWKLRIWNEFFATLARYASDLIPAGILSMERYESLFFFTPFSPPISWFIAKRIYRSPPLCLFPSLQSGQLFADFGSRLATPRPPEIPRTCPPLLPPPPSPPPPASAIHVFIVSLDRDVSSALRDFPSKSRFFFFSRRSRSKEWKIVEDRCDFLFALLRESTRREETFSRAPRGSWTETSPWKIYFGQWRVIVRGGVVVEAGACGEVQIDRTLKQGREGNEGSRLGE